MKFATMTYTFSRQADSFDLDRVLRWTAHHMDGVDFFTLHGFPPKELRARVDDLGIPVAAYTFLARGLASENPAEVDAAVDECRRNVEAAAILGAPVVMIPPLNELQIPRDAQRRRWIKGLQRVVPFARTADIALTVENFPGANSPFVLASDFAEARKVIPELKLTFDNGNAGSGEDPAESFARCAADVVHAHCKDWHVSGEPRDGYRLMLDGRYYRPALIGEGDIDHRACLRAMRKAGYDRFINIEYEGDAYNPFEATERATNYLRGLIAEGD